MRHLTEEEDEDDEGESDSEMEEKKEESADGELQVEVEGEEGDRERLLAAGPSDTGWSVGEPTEVKGVALDVGDAVETGAEGERQSAYLALTIQSPGASSNAAAGSLSVEQEGVDMREDEAGGVGVMPQRLSFDAESGSGVPRKREGRGYERAAGREDEDNEGGRVLEGAVEAGLGREMDMVETEAQTAANDCDSTDAGETGGEVDAVDVSGKGIGDQTLSEEIAVTYGVNQIMFSQTTQQKRDGLHELRTTMTSDLFADVMVGDTITMTSATDMAHNSHKNVQYEVVGVDVEVHIVPPLEVASSKLTSSFAVVREAGSCNVTEVIRGTKENAECGNRGLCDRTSGLCNCFPGFAGISCETQEVLD